MFSRIDVPHIIGVLCASLWRGLPIAFSSPGLSIAEPATFEHSRLALFTSADFNGDGVVSDGTAFERPWESRPDVSELETLVGSAVEVRWAFSNATGLRKSAAEDKLVDGLEPLQNALADGNLTKSQWFHLSRTLLHKFARTPKLEGADWPYDVIIPALSLLSLHRFNEAENRFVEIVNGGVLPPGEIAQLARRCQDDGLFLEARSLWNALWTAQPDGPGRGTAEQFSRSLPKAKEGWRHVQPPDSYAKAPYIEELRKATSCREIPATEEALLEAFRESKPAVMRSAGLVPGIETWAEALSEEKQAAGKFSVAVDGQFYFTESWPDPNGTGINTTWAVRPAQAQLFLEDAARAAQLDGARFYIEYGGLPEIFGNTKLSSLVAGAPDIASKLYLQTVNLWAALGGGTVSLIHQDGHENILAQIHGSKEVILWPPGDREHLDYESKPGVWLRFRCCPGDFSRQFMPEDKRSNIGGADVRHPDLYPSLRKSKPSLCRLNPGDALVLPAGWHHMVVSYPGNEKACTVCDAWANLAINFWFLPDQSQRRLQMRARYQRKGGRGEDNSSGILTGDKDEL